MIHHQKPVSSILGISALLLACVLAGAPATSAATSSQFANNWSSTVPVQWFPQPPSANVLGPPEDPPGVSMCVGASNTPCCSDASFTFPNFSIPAGDVIQGVEVNVKYESDGLADIVLTDGGAPAGDTKVLPVNPGPSTCDGTSFDSVGGPTDTFGLALTPADFNTGQIGFRLTQQLTTVGGSPGSVPIDIDAVELIVHHGPANSAPTAEANGPYFVPEGGSVALSSAGSSDPDGDTLTFAWDLDDDGTFETPGASPLFSAAGRDGPSTQTVNLRVSDGLATDEDTATVNITNVAPTVAAPSVAPEPSEEGAAATASAGFSDPGGVLDAPYTCTVDYGDGGPPVAGTVVGFTCNGPPHVYGDNGSYTVTVSVTDKDLASGSASTIHQVTNVPPTVAEPTVAPEPSDEGSPVTASATFSDPATDDSPFSCTVDYGEGDGPVAGSVTGLTCDGPSHAYGDNGTYTVEVCVTDKDGDTGCESTSHEVENVPPTVATPTFSAEPSAEGDAVTASAGFTDPGENDGPFTCTVDYDTADTAVVPVAGTVSGSTCTGPGYTYGDNGTFTVEVCVTDKDDGEGCATADHVVDNVAPDAQLDTSGAIAFPGGDAFLGRQGVEQSHDAEADDPGSDDLTFAWDFGFSGSGVSTTYYNDTGDPSGTPDPPLSPHGTFPFSAADSASVTFADPGVFSVRVDVTDDDAGTDFDDLPKLVTGAGDCSRSQGFWRHQFSDHGHQHFTVVTLQAYLDLVDFASAVFSEQVAASTPADAQAVFAPGGTFRDKATRQALAAWLNWAAGNVAWDEGIDTDGDLLPDTPFSVVIAMVEAILLDADATHHELELAKDLAEAVNLLDELNPDCADPTGLGSSRGDRPKEVPEDAGTS